ncbi:WSC-domain-containing protein [Auricularia subglabra TFB-10046 SS5]|nr:WSC-domain-containing protein [Auricularia subglabra TFB-10046 SS5]
MLLSLLTLSLLLVSSIALPAPRPRSVAPVRQLSRDLVIVPPQHPLLPPTASLPRGWAILSACSLDEPPFLASPSIAWLSKNTPAICVAHCERAGYTYAGVRQGKECHCATSTNSTSLSPVNHDLCSTPCSGDASQTCGGTSHIALYYTPSTPATALPYGQCGGMAWTGPEACPTGFMCKFYNVLYSQCSI